MIPKLQNNQRFINDLKNYQLLIDQITDNVFKKETEQLLVALKEQVLYVDRSHEQMLITGRISSDLSDYRSKIIEIKKNLDRKIAAWQRQAAVKPEPRPNVG